MGSAALTIGGRHCRAKDRDVGWIVFEQARDGWLVGKSKFLDGGGRTVEECMEMKRTAKLVCFVMCQCHVREGKGGGERVSA